MSDYPRRLYLRGEVLEGDPHATNSVVVQNAAQEGEARAKGYRTAWEGIPVSERRLTPKANAAQLTPQDDAEEEFVDAEETETDEEAEAAVTEEPAEQPAKAPKAKGRRGADRE